MLALFPPVCYSNYTYSGTLFSRFYLWTVSAVHSGRIGQIFQYFKIIGQEEFHGKTGFQREPAV